MELSPPNRLQRVRESAFRILLVVAALLLLAGLILPAMSSTGKMPRRSITMWKSGETNELIVLQVPACASLDLVLKPAKPNSVEPTWTTACKGTLSFIRNGSVSFEIPFHHRGGANAGWFKKTIYMYGASDSMFPASSLQPGSLYLVRAQFDEPLPTGWELGLSAMVMPRHLDQWRGTLVSKPVAHRVRP